MFKASVILAVASVAAAQLSIPYTPLTQCGNSVINVNNAATPYYLAVLPAQDPCNSNSIAEYHNVYGSLNYFATLPKDTSVVIYVVDASGAESFSEPITVTDGDASCLGTTTSEQVTPFANDVTNDTPPPENVAPEVDTDAAATTTVETSSASTPLSMTYSVDSSEDDNSDYVPTNNDNSGSTSSNSNSNSNSFGNPINAADSLGAATSVTLSFTTLGLSAFVALIALF